MIITKLTAGESDLVIGLTLKREAFLTDTQRPCHLKSALTENHFLQTPWGREREETSPLLGKQGECPGHYCKAITNGSLGSLSTGFTLTTKAQFCKLLHAGRPAELSRFDLHRSRDG